MSGVDGARSFYQTLARSLARAKLSDAEAHAVTSAVRGLSTSAPLTLDLLDELELSAGLRSNLIFAWMHHCYPTQVESELGAANTLADVVRQLIGEDGDDLPVWAVDFHTALTTPKTGVSVVDAFARTIEAADLRFFGENDGSIVFVAETPDDEHDVVITHDGATWRAALDDTDVGTLTELPKRTLSAMKSSLARAAKSAAVGDEGAQLAADLAAILEDYTPPMDPLANRVETLLRLELGANRVGESKLGALNDLIGEVLTASEAAFSGDGGAAVEDALLDLVSRRPRGRRPSNVDVPGDDVAETESPPKRMPPSIEDEVRTGHLSRELADLKCQLQELVEQVQPIRR